jgi:MoaA/NifB/PqqE/SkfB family radical SAM enzyme
MRARTRIHRLARIAGKVAWALLDRSHPLLVHVVPMRRCNLSCAYCSEYDTVSKPVAIAAMLERIDRLADLGTAMVTISGGEPLMHPDLDRIVARSRRRGMLVSVISNGYYLSLDRIDGLNRAGLDHLQISIDNVEPDESSTKSLRILEPKLRWLAERANFTVAINSVLGGGVRRPEDAIVIARRARELGFGSSLSIAHDGQGQLKALNPVEMRVYEELRRIQGLGFSRLNRRFQDNLAHGRPHEWSCRAGSRYLYVDEKGIVSYCSQQRGTPGVPLASFTREDVRREYRSKKSCAPFCTVNCVQQVALLDNWRSPQGSPAAAQGDGALAG